MATTAPHEVVLQIPNIGLSEAQIEKLKTAFHSQFVATLGEKAAASIRIRIKIQIEIAE